MKKINLKVWTFVLVACTLYVTSCNTSQQESSKDNALIEATPEDIIEKGAYLVEIMGCNDCHSPKKMGKNGPEIIPELLLSGYPADRPIAEFKDPMIKEGFSMFYPDLTAGAGPWGLSFAGNLTPDETGIGSWTEEQFKVALTQGKFKGQEDGRMLLPPMPWVNYRNMKEEDVHAIFMYLKSIPSVKNVVPSPIPPS